MKILKPAAIKEKWTAFWSRTYSLGHLIKIAATSCVVFIVATSIHGNTRQNNTATETVPLVEPSISVIGLVNCSPYVDGRIGTTIDPCQKYRFTHHPSISSDAYRVDGFVRGITHDNMFFYLVELRDYDEIIRVRLRCTPKCQTPEDLVREYEALDSDQFATRLSLLVQMKEGFRTTDVSNGGDQ